RQADSSTTRVHGGLGLGLSIVRHLVEAHHGSVTVHSDGPGRGATFVVQFPIEAASRADDRSARAKRTADAPSLRGLSVLIVDDEDRRLALAAGFQMHLAKPIDAESLVSAVASLARGSASKLISTVQ